MKRLTTWIAVGIAVFVVTVVVVVSVVDWQLVGDSGIDLNGWIALILGAAVTLALGIGLMALIFISNRRGYDDPTGSDG